MIMNRLITLLAGVLFTLSLPAKSTPFGKGTMTVRTIAHNAVRITYSENGATSANLAYWR